MKRLLLFLATVCLGLTGFASGQSRKVTLKLTNVNGSEAVEALRTYSDRELVMRAPPDPARTASFQWKAVPFSQALRQVCERFDLRVLRGSDYSLGPDRLFIQNNPREQLCAVEKDGFRIYVSSRGIARPKLPQDQPDELRLTLDVGLGEHDWSTINSISPVRAQDDLGNVLTRSRWSGFPQRFHLDEWATSFGLGPVNPKAKRLNWLEGDLNVRKISRRLEVKATLPKPGGTKQTRLDGNTVEIEIQGKEPVSEIITRVTIVPRPGLEVDYDSVIMRLVGVSGEHYHSTRGGAKYRKEATSFHFDLTGTYEVPEPVTGSLVSWVERSPAERLLQFRLTNIPLPIRGAEQAAAHFLLPQFDLLHPIR